VLPAWQIVFIAAGRGRFESRHQPCCEITAGAALLLFPGEWHRYAPDPRTGWTELWVELQGPACARLQTAGEWSPESPCTTDLDRTPVESLLRRIHVRLREPATATTLTTTTNATATTAATHPLPASLSSGFLPETSAGAWHLVAHIAEARHRRDP
jgi:hypothetical protein